MRRIGYLLLFAGAIPAAHAQFFEFQADWSCNQFSDTRGLSADITATLKARSPWGEITSVESGKYWRSSKGQDRFDDSHGLSNLRDRSGPVIHARIDRELRLVEIEEETTPRVPSAFSPSPWNILPFSFNKGGEKTVEGLKATVRTGADHGVNYEVWTSDELGLVLYAKYTTDTTVFEQRLHNIRFAEPDQGIVSVSIPSGFRTHITCWSSSDNTWEAPRQTYEPGRDFCK